MTRLQHLQTEALSLPVTERAALAQALLDSLDDSAPVAGWTAEWSQEAARRAAARDSGAMDEHEWPVALQQLQAELQTGDHS